MTESAAAMVPAPSESVVDYRGYDFRSVWVGRQSVDRFDQALLRLALRRLDLRRTLEIGTGFGRLTPSILGGGGEYVGVDYDLGGLREARGSVVPDQRPNPHTLWLAANAYHLPFATGSFSAVCMVRVHHHLANPGLALREVVRVLSPGGTALVTFSAWTRFGAAAHDARRLLRRPKVRNDRYLLRARGGHVEVRDVPLRQYVTSARRFFDDLASCGLVPDRSFGGPETMAARLLPLPLGLAAGTRWPGAPVFSTRWVVARKPGSPAPLPAWEEILACPRCGGSGPRLESGTPVGGPCRRCGLDLAAEGGVLDARYVPSAPSAVGPTDAPSPE